MLFSDYPVHGILKNQLENITISGKISTNVIEQMPIPKTLLKKYPEILDWSILTAYRGSIAHGLYVPSNDSNSIDDKDIMAICIPPIQYYFGLEEYGSRGTREIKHRQWDIVIFVGYAKGQLHRMTHLAFQGYMGEKRKRLVMEFGYDTKNACHLIRLLKMSIEFLNEGRLYVKRHEDADMLLSIKRGEWSLEQIKKEADRLFKLAEIANMKSKLPEYPDHEKINKLCVDILQEHFLTHSCSVS